LSIESAARLPAIAFCQRGIQDHRNQLALNQNKDISLATKSEHYLGILNRVKDKFENLIKDLPEDQLKYRGILS